MTECDIVFHGWANENPLTNAELDALYTWSTQGKGMVIIAEHPESAPYPKPHVTERWGYNSTSPTTNPTIPTAANNNHPIFAGPFGTVTTLEQAGTLRGYITVPICQGATVLARDTNGNGRPTVVYDGSTGDIILPDIDMLTGLNPAISNNSGINTDQERFLANLFAFAIAQAQNPPEPAGIFCADLDQDSIFNVADLDDDNDGIPDSIEDQGTSNDGNLSDSDGDGAPDSQDLDSDNDGIPDHIEAQTTEGYSAPLGDAGSHNGLDSAYGSGLTPINSDGTNDIPDYLDLDSDDDGISDATESGIRPGIDTNGDGIGDAVGASFSDPNGPFNNGASDLANSNGTSNVDFREPKKVFIYMPLTVR